MTVEIAETQKPAEHTLRIVEFFLSLFLRVLATIFFGVAILVWMQAIGIWEGPHNRFDTMDPALRIYIAVMAVILPVASVGLWTTLAWGRVIWFFVMTFQSVSVLRFPEYFDVPVLVVIFHVVCLAIYLALQISHYIIAKKE